MGLTKEDLNEIKKIVNDVVGKSEIKISDKIEFAISQSEQRLGSEIKETVDTAKEEVLAALHREVSVMTEMHIKEAEELESHEMRIVRIEKEMRLTA